MQFVATLLGIALLAALVINGTLMLISPRRWFGLPRWISATGPLTIEKYGTGSGAVQIRITGAVFVAGVLWVLYDMFARHR